MIVTKDNDTKIEEKRTNECIKGSKSWENTVIPDNVNLDGQEIAELCSDVTVLAPVLETFQPPNSTCVCYYWRPDL